jgi:hypothetical protein
MKDAARQPAPDGGWLVGIPLSEKGETFGAMVLLEKPVTGSLLEKRMELLSGISRQAATAIQNDLLRDKKLENEKLQQEFRLAGIFNMHSYLGICHKLKAGIWIVCGNLPGR